MSRSLLILDAPNLTMRSVWAMKGGSSFTNQGAYTGPLVLFIKVLGYQIRKHSPGAVVVCWEGESVFRHDMYSEYKAQRPKDKHPLRDVSFSLIQRFLDLSGFSQTSIDGFEADDVIASLVRKHRDTHRINILSADKDLLQLVDNNVSQIRLGSGGGPTTVWGPDEVRDKYKCSPEQLPTLMAVMGDRGDGIPGVPGLGPKKAVRALNDHGWDLTTNDHPDIISNREDALMGYDLINLRTPVVEPDISGTRIVFLPPKKGSQRYKKLVDFLVEYNLNDIRVLLERGELWEK